MSTAVISPIITAIFWITIKGWGGWSQVLYAALLGILIFLSGWGIVFIVSFVHAPTVLFVSKRSN
jgi:ABC-type Fe3+ transport system permease subunit